VTEKGLGEEQDQGCHWSQSKSTINRHGLLLTLSELPVHLSTEEMEDVCRSGAVCDLHVAVLVLTIELIRRREDAGILERSVSEEQ